MRGVVSLAAAFGVPLTTLSGDAVPRTPAHRVPHVRRRDRHAAAARADPAVADPAPRCAGRRGQQRRDRRGGRTGQGREGGGRPARRAAGRRRTPRTCTSGPRTCCAAGTPGAATRRGSGSAATRRRSARARRRRSAGFGWKCWRPNAAAFIAERDSGRIDDEVLRSVLHGLDLEEATLNRKVAVSTSWARNARIASMSAEKVRCAAARSSSGNPRQRAGGCVRPAA